MRQKTRPVFCFTEQSKTDVDYVVFGELKETMHADVTNVKMARKNMTESGSIRGLSALVAFNILYL